MAGGSDPRTPIIQQACVIPFRLQQESLKFCLITSLKRKKWIFPKGVVEPGETLLEAGLKEAWEEAGLRGRIIGDPLGSYFDQKWGSRLEVTVMLMSVTSSADDWPEVLERQRCWMSCQATHELLGENALGNIFRMAVKERNLATIRE